MPAINNVEAKLAIKIIFKLKKEPQITPVSSDSYTPLFLSYLPVILPGKIGINMIIASFLH